VQSPLQAPGQGGGRPDVVVEGGDGGVTVANSKPKRAMTGTTDSMTSVIDQPAMFHGEASREWNFNLMYKPRRTLHETPVSSQMAWFKNLNKLPQFQCGDWSPGRHCAALKILCLMDSRGRMPMYRLVLFCCIMSLRKRGWNFAFSPLTFGEGHRHPRHKRPQVVDQIADLYSHACSQP